MWCIGRLCQATFCYVTADFTDFTSTAVLLYVMLSYVMLNVMLFLLKMSECLFGAVKKIT